MNVDDFYPWVVYRIVDIHVSVCKDGQGNDQTRPKENVV